MLGIDDYDVLILPGWHGSDADHWQSHWERTFPTARRVAQADWERPVYADWAKRLDEEIARCTRPALLVGHSLGTSLATRWASQHPGTASAAVAGAFLVACSDRDRWDGESAFPAGFGPMILRPLPFPAVVVISEDDPRVTPARARAFASAWDAGTVEAGALGHMGAGSNLGVWPAGLVWLGALLQSLDATAPVTDRGSPSDGKSPSDRRSPT